MQCTNIDLLNFRNSDYGINVADVFMLVSRLIVHDRHIYHSDGAKKLEVKTENFKKSDLPFFLKCAAESIIKIST